MLICAYAHVSVQVCSHEYAMPMSVYAHVYMYSWMCSYIFTCYAVLVCADIHLCVHVCSHVYDMLIFVHASYAYVCICSHAYMLSLCIHVCVYTHEHVCACSWIQVLMHVICMCAYTCLFHDSVCTQLTKPSPMPPFQRFLDSGLHFWALPGYWSHPCALTRSWHSLHFCTWSAESSFGGGGSDGRFLHVSGSPRLSRIPLPQIFFKPAVWCHIGFAEPVSVSDLKTLWQQQWYLKGHERADNLPGRKPRDFT